MPWGWEFRAKLIKQIPAKPTQHRGKVLGELTGPGPMQYDAPEILGSHKIKLGLVSPRIEAPEAKTLTPGPAAYVPRTSIRYKRTPAFSIRPAARPPYEPWDQWTPSPNMYLPHQPGRKRPPAYTFGNALQKSVALNQMPCPGSHDPNFNYIRRTKPAFSFGAPYKSLREPQKPAPNAYCQKKVTELVFTFKLLELDKMVFTSTTPMDQNHLDSGTRIHSRKVTILYLKYQRDLVYLSVRCCCIETD
ncbi:jg10708 [Pararge aegeria aegeria]|uniref:Jg10708 protein n=1 Tax=Pararge aegeria aegeria TaxID=348720 RepID=A0A8S4RGF0_9NEOP|nr:jg10708 [Pararge aegeria aegeria]